MQKRATQKRTVRRKASSDDVIGADFSEKVPKRWRVYYNRLIDMRSYLRNDKRSQLQAANDQNLSYGQHMADAGTNSFEKDLALSRVSFEQDALFEIGAALDRIEEGTYGICELTGKPIEPERLTAIPWARFCAEAERALEAQGKIKRAHLPPPEPLGTRSTANRVGEEWEVEVKSERKPESKLPETDES